MPSVPRLLVSVRNQAEALIAAESGVDIIDFKEPAHGSLGMVPSEELNRSLQTLGTRDSAETISLACGEVLDSPGSPIPCWTGVRYLKLGLAGLRQVPDWQRHWKLRQEQLLDSFQGSNAPPGWIAVAYVDDRLANAPPIEEVIDAAISEQCAGVLFDTWSKRDGNLFTSLPADRLNTLTARIQNSGLIVAAAGKVTLQDLPQLLETGVDLIGIRSAACRNSVREQAICPNALTRFRNALRDRAVRIN